MFLTADNAKDYIGKALDSTHRLFHHYPLTVIQLENGEYAYKDKWGTCYKLSPATEKFNRVFFDIVENT